mgnify:FL=1
MDIVLNLINNKIKSAEPIINGLYMVVFAVYFTYIFVGTTMISDRLLILPYRMCTLILTLIVAYRFITIKKSEWKEGILMGAIIAVTAGYFIVHNLKLYFIWGMMLIGAKNVSFHKIVKTAVIIGTLIMITALVLSQAGIIEDVVKLNGRGSTQHSLGINYSTDCSAHVLYLMMGYCVLKNGKLKKSEYVIGITIAVLIFFATRARNNFMCVAILISATFIYQFFRAIFENDSSKKLIVFSTIAFVIICCAAMLYMTMAYNWDNTPMLSKIDRIISGRLNLGKTAFNNYRISLFGNNIPQAGSGRGGSDFYFFIDSSYVLVLLERGILLFTIMCILTIKNIFKAYKNNCIYIAGIVAIIALQCMFEHHWMDLSYNYFLLMTFASLSD